MRGGRLNQRVTLERTTPTQNSYGEQVDAWATLATRWASIVAKSGAEQFGSQTEKSKQVFSVMLRYGADISTLTTTDRMTYDSRVFDIESVSNLHEENHWVELLVTERDD